MPKVNREGEPIAEEMPDTLKRSSRKAQRTFGKTHDAAFEEYGEESRAHRVAYAALKRKFKKLGNRWMRRKNGKS